MDGKLLIICNNSTGLKDFRGMLIEELILRGYELFIIVPKSDSEIDLDAEKYLTNRGCHLINIEINRRGKNPIKDVVLFNNYKNVIKKLHPNLVVTYTIKPNIYGGFACRILNVPYIVNITGLGSAFENGGIIRKMVTIMNRVACKKAEVVFFENESNRQKFIQQKIVKESQTVRLNGAGVDIDKFQVTEYRDEKTTRFLFIGRVMAEKGIDELFEAMKKLISDGIHCELDVLGGYEENYKDMIESYETEGWLHYHGFQKDVRPFIERCHCFVLPSWHEGMANTNLECAASGRPVITSNIPGCMEAIEDGVTGFLTECKNVDSLYRVMKRFVELSYEERKAMGIAGRKRMETIFDKKKVVSETITHIININSNDM